MLLKRKGIQFGVRVRVRAGGILVMVRMGARNKSYALDMVIMMFIMKITVL